MTSRRQWFRISTPAQCPQTSPTTAPGGIAGAVRWTGSSAARGALVGFFDAPGIAQHNQTSSKGEIGLHGSMAKACRQRVSTRPCPDSLATKRGVLERIEP